MPRKLLKRKRGKRRNGLITRTNLPIMKFENFLQDSGAITTTGHVTTLTVGQDVGSNRRVGNIMRCLKLEYHYYLSPSATDGNDIIRVLFLRAKSSSFTLTNCPELNEPLDPFQAEKLADHIVPMYSIQNSTDGPGTVKKVISGVITLGSRVYFNGPNYDDYTSGFYMIYMVSDSAATPYPTIDGWCRLYFADN